MLKVAAQGYTVRDFLKTPKDFAKTCKRIKEIGYDSIQLSGDGPIDPKKKRKMLDDAGLTCCVTHRKIDEIEADPQKFIDEHHILGTPYCAIGGFFPPQEDWSRKTWEKFVVRFNKVAKILAKGGIQFGYHNHSHEFVMAGDIRPFDFLLGHLEAPCWFEIDTYWVSVAGADPAEYIRRCAGRIPCVHFKETIPQRDHTMLMGEIGDGTQNWPAIIEACRYAGTKWVIVERDRGEMDPFDSLARSLENLHNKYNLY
ncbi:MAG: sugar phosphate isomerase/epimerase [Victivallales bacterium]|nr:sugar phosphate isomerase/epimerase [Victivallales bacterium]